MRILLIRHGRDNPEYRGGWSQRSLIDEGIQQSKAAGLYLQKYWQPIDYCISSDLTRAAQTAIHITDALKLPIHYDTAWREINNGELAGMLHTTALARYPGLFASSLAMDETYPNGESPQQFYERITQAFTQLCTVMLAQDLPTNVVVVTHAGVINIIYYLVKGLAWTNKAQTFPTTETGIHEISYADSAWTLTIENDTNHLNTQSEHIPKAV